MYNIFSVKLLFEYISSPKHIPDKTFEETINIIKADKVEDINGLVVEHFKDLIYTNALGGVTTVKLVKILDIFELVENIEEIANYTEVYSRYILFENDISAKKVIELYSLDK